MASTLLRRRSATVVTSLLVKHTHQYQTLAASSLLANRAKSIDSRLASLLSPPPPPPKRFSDESVRSVKNYEYMFPSFSYGVVLNPIFKTEVEEDEVLEEEVDGSEMWADSTKKKRKKKMNKHKYRKMRRKLRHRG